MTTNTNTKLGRGIAQLRFAANNLWNENGYECHHRASKVAGALARWLEYGRPYRPQVIAELNELVRYIEHLQESDI